MGDEPSLKAMLQAEGLWADKRLGQHFLLDLGVTRRIASLAGPVAGLPVIEVGPGPGGLSIALLEAGADPLIAIETDPRFRPLLEAHGARFGGRLRLIEADALAVDEAGLLGGVGPAALVANLPYNVGTPLLVKWLKAAPAWRGPMTLMFQKEVAQRIVAAPNSDHYGRLAVLAQTVCTAHIGLTLPAGAFTPPPKVASAVVCLRDRPAPFDDLDGLEIITAAAFGQRRKMLRSALSGLCGGPDAAVGLLTAAGLDPQARAEALPPAAFVRLTQTWRASATP
jgi:16S rRNA (adenine1518-N6/adenine1519-N6)-dimethyltransferase